MADETQIETGTAAGSDGEPQGWDDDPTLAGDAQSDAPPKVFTWGLIRRGDCTLFEGAKWTLLSSGDAYFDATVTSGSDDDSWLIRGVALKDGNGAILTYLEHYGPWSADHNTQFWKDLPDSSQRYRWFDHGTFPRHLFDQVATMRLMECHC